MIDWRELAFALALMIAMLGGLALVTPVGAAPIAAAGGDGVTVTLYDEPCELAAVVNLSRRATWVEKGVVIEGCYAIGRGLAMFYFADRTVLAIPSSAFAAVSSS